MLKTLVEHWPYNPANCGYIPVHKPDPHSPSTQVFTSLYHPYPPGPGIFPYPPVGVELPWAASPHKGKGSFEHSVARAIGSGCYCCCFSSFCLPVGLCSRPARHIALQFPPSTRARSFETYRTSSWATFAPWAATTSSSTSSRRHVTKPAHEKGRAPERATNRGETAKPLLSKDSTCFRRMTNSTPLTSSAPPAPRRARPTRRSPLRRTTFRLLLGYRRLPKSNA